MTGRSSEPRGPLLRAPLWPGLQPPSLSDRPQPAEALPGARGQPRGNPRVPPSFTTRVRPLLGVSMEIYIACFSLPLSHALWLCALTSLGPSAVLSPPRPMRFGYSGSFYQEEKCLNSTTLPWECDIPSLAFWI